MNRLSILAGWAWPGSQAAIGPNAFALVYVRTVNAEFCPTMTFEYNGTQTLGNTRTGAHFDGDVFIVEPGFRFLPLTGLYVSSGLGLMHATSDEFHIYNPPAPPTSASKIDAWIPEWTVGAGWQGNVWFAEFRYRRGLSGIVVQDD